MPSKKVALVIGLILFALMPLWYWGIVPKLTGLPSDFSYNAVVFSRDNFYLPEKSDFTGEQVSNTNYGYEVMEIQDGVLIIKNRFEVQEFNGKTIFKAERLYGINPRTHQHVYGYGDQDREGYLFAPPHLRKGQDFVYWHVNYDRPAKMVFQGEEMISGLNVYRYETDYQADQTEELQAFLRDQEKTGINVDINLQLWVEPVTGRMIKYEDRATAYFYNTSSGERTHPWNKFQNRFDEVSILKQVELAKQEKFKRLLLRETITGLLALAGAVLILYPSFINRK